MSMKSKEGSSKNTSLEPEQIVSGVEESADQQGIDQAVIQTIPDKYYGAALKAHLSQPATVDNASKASSETSSQKPPKQKTITLPLIIVGVFILLIAGGGFVYFNQDLLFGPSEPIGDQEPDVIVQEPPAPPAPPAPPSAPVNLIATSTSPTVVQLNWQDVSSNEAGFRVERRDATGEYRSITSLPPNSAAYQDASVSAATSYLYRIIAMNEGGDSPASNEYSVLTPEEPVIPEPEKLPPAGLDSDSDGLTDLEEPLYGTSPRDPDADRDSFLDGNEVFHLYNPAGGANVKLIESGLVKSFESPIGWRIYVPSIWKATTGMDGMTGTVTTGHGETFTIALVENADRLSVLDWYLSRNPGVLSSATAMITTKGGLEGLEGADLLTTYFAWGDSILVFTYRLNDQSFVNFRQTYEMMKNSLFLSDSPNIPSDATFPESQDFSSDSNAVIDASGTEPSSDLPIEEEVPDAVSSDPDDSSNPDSSVVQEPDDPDQDILAGEESNSESEANQTSSDSSSDTEPTSDLDEPILDEEPIIEPEVPDEGPAGDSSQEDSDAQVSEQFLNPGADGFPDSEEPEAPPEDI